MVLIPPHRAASLCGYVLAAICLIGGCVGEDSVVFEGTVTEANEPGHSFDAELNPAGRPPIAGATVAVFVDKGSCTSGEPVDADGRFSDGTVYGGFACSSHVATVCARAPGFEDVRLEFPTSDSERTDGKLFLNITMRRKP